MTDKARIKQLEEAKEDSLKILDSSELEPDDKVKFIRQILEQALQKEPPSEEDFYCGMRCLAQCYECSNITPTSEPKASEKVAIDRNNLELTDDGHLRTKPTESYTEADLEKAKIEAKISELRVQIYTIQANLMDSPQESNPEREIYQIEIKHMEFCIEEYKQQLEKK